MMDLKQLKGQLSVNSAVVCFLKNDGSKRVMLCTRNTAMVYNDCPGIAVALDARDSKVDTSKTLAVIDVEKKDIRAFVYDRLMYVVLTGDLREIREHFNNKVGRASAFQELAKEMDNFEKTRNATIQQSIRNKVYEYVRK